MTPPKEPVGSVAEEAAKLFAVLQQASADARGAEAPPPTEPSTEEPPAADDVPAADHQHGTECQWCPVCQLIGKVRRTSPETIEQLSSAAAGVLGAVRGLVEAAAEAARQAKVDAESRTAGEQDNERPARSRVDRIDVSEDPEPWD
jgi:hypothetical protein